MLLLKVYPCCKSNYWIRLIDFKKVNKKKQEAWELYKISNVQHGDDIDIHFERFEKEYNLRND